MSMKPVMLVLAFHQTNPMSMFWRRMSMKPVILVLATLAFLPGCGRETGDKRSPASTVATADKAQPASAGQSTTKKTEAPESSPSAPAAPRTKLPAEKPHSPASVTFRYENGRIAGATASTSDGVELGTADFKGYANGPKGQLWTLVEETHFDPDGSKRVIYKGKLYFTTDSQSVAKEERIEGTKQRQLFSTWPRP